MIRFEKSTGQKCRQRRPKAYQNCRTVFNICRIRRECSILRSLKQENCGNDQTSAGVVPKYSLKHFVK